MGIEFQLEMRKEVSIDREGGMHDKYHQNICSKKLQGIILFYTYLNHTQHI